MTECPRCGALQDRPPDPDDERNDLCPPCVEEIFSDPVVVDAMERLGPPDLVFSNDEVGFEMLRRFTGGANG